MSESSYFRRRRHGAIPLVGAVFTVGGIPLPVGTASLDFADSVGGIFQER
jgi:hypothetical protein